MVTQRDADGVAGAVDQAREHVAADLVGAEPEFGAGRLIGLADDLGLAIGRDPAARRARRWHRSAMTIMPNQALNGAVLQRRAMTFSEHGCGGP